MDFNRQGLALDTMNSQARNQLSEAQFMASEGRYATLRLPSGEMRLVDARCRATVGRVGNVDHINVSLGKAGRKRWKGIRPTTRGSAMNPVDHPHGGGEGKAPARTRRALRGASAPSVSARARRTSPRTSSLCAGDTGARQNCERDGDSEV